MQVIEFLTGPYAITYFCSEVGINDVYAGAPRIAATTNRYWIGTLLALNT